MIALRMKQVYMIVTWCSMNRVIFCLIDAFKKWKTGKLFHHCDTPIYEFFCYFFFDTSIKGKKNIKNPINFISHIMLLAYRDSGNIYSYGSTSYGSFSTKNYECVGNETSIHDCPNNENNCTTISTAKFRPRTELRCKRKTY